MAKMCLEQIRGGADFAELASSISDCQATRAKGGEVGGGGGPWTVVMFPQLSGFELVGRGVGGRIENTMCAAWHPCIYNFRNCRQCKQH